MLCERGVWNERSSCILTVEDHSRSCELVHKHIIIIIIIIIIIAIIIIIYLCNAIRSTHSSSIEHQ